MEFNKSETVFFTGHRKISDDEADFLHDLLRCTVLIYIKRGYKNFITGGAVGFDSAAAECLACLKSEGYGINHILALPCRDQTSKWSDLEDLTFYKKMLGEADEVVYTGTLYTRGCMHARNRYMVDNSSVCIAYRTKEKGGTAYTCKYAEKEGLEVVNLAKMTTQITFC